AILLIFAWISSIQGVYAQTALKVSAHTFAIQPKVGMVASHTRSGVLIDAVYGDLKTTLTLFESRGNRFLLVTSALGIDGYLRAPIIILVQDRLALSSDALVTFSSHSHTVPWLWVDENSAP